MKTETLTKKSTWKKIKSCVHSLTASDFLDDVRSPNVQSDEGDIFHPVIIFSPQCVEIDWDFISEAENEWLLFFMGTATNQKKIYIYFK